jgi:hypothetical protein
MQKTFVSSTLSLEVGVKVISKAEYNAWYQSQREQLQRAACDEIYQSLTSKESQRIRAEMEREGALFVEAARPDYSRAPEPWEISSFESRPDMGGKILVELRKAKDAHSFTRLHLFENELFERYEGRTLDELIDRDLESTRSLWAHKAERMKVADTQKRTERIVERSVDELGRAAHEVAKFENATNSEKSELMADPIYRSKLAGARKAINAARSFK